LRDILTIIASLVILVLSAALIAPPLIDWEGQRDWIDGAITQAAGTDARTDGAIELRLLPSPRLQVEGLRIGDQAPGTAALEARGVTTELDLTPLLRGEVRFREARAERAEIRIPRDERGGFRLRPDLLDAARTNELTVENLQIGRLTVTAVVPATGRTDQFRAEDVTIEAQRLAGPWRAEGLSAGVPFRLVTGELAPDGTVQVKLAGGGDRVPRFDVDARLALAGDAPAATGTARLAFGPPAQAVTSGVQVPVVVQTTFKTEDRAILLDPLTVEAGEGAAIRLSGTGTFRTDDPRLTLRLEGRRVDAEPILVSSDGRSLQARLADWAPALPTFPVDLSLGLGSIGLAGEELADVVLRGALDREGVRVEEFALTGPGNSRLLVSGRAALAASGSASGRIGLTSSSSDRLARYLDRLGLRGPFGGLLDGRPLDVSTDVALAPPVLSFSNARLRVGDALLTGSGRYTAPEANARGRLEAQIAAQGIDIQQLPQVSGLFEATQYLDIGFTLDGRDIRDGPQRTAGRITARIQSDGPTLVVETLDIANLAGANARVSGRITPNGTGRIAGRVTAQRAAPLVDLIGTLWVGGVTRLVPPFLREGALDLEVVSERTPATPGAPDLTLRTSVRGTAAGGRFEGEALSRDGATQTLLVRLGTDNTGRWIDRPNLPALRRPSTLEIAGTRTGAGRYSVTLAGDVAGARLATLRPFAFDTFDGVVDTGEADVTAADITPFLTLMGEGAAGGTPVPVQGRVSVAREGSATLLQIGGRVAGEGVNARLLARSRSEITGEVAVDRLSLPWLVNALALNAPAEPRPTAPWSAARFGEPGRLLAGLQAQVSARRVDLGRGLEAENAGLRPRRAGGRSLDPELQREPRRRRADRRRTECRAGRRAGFGVGRGHLAGGLACDPRGPDAVRRHPVGAPAIRRDRGDPRRPRGRSRRRRRDAGVGPPDPQCGPGGSGPGPRAAARGGRSPRGAAPRCRDGRGVEPRAVPAAARDRAGHDGGRFAAPQPVPGRWGRRVVAGLGGLRRQDPRPRRPGHAHGPGQCAGLDRRLALHGRELARALPRAVARDRHRPPHQRRRLHRAAAGA
jgi:hypothetical protein